METSVASSEQLVSIETRISLKRILEGLTIKTTCLRGRVTVRRRADEINFGRGVSTPNVYDEAADRK